MSIKRITLYSIVICFISSCNFFNETKSDRIDDLNYLISELSERHINLFDIKSKTDLEQDINQIKNKCQNLSDLEFALEIQKLIASYGDSHTKINWEKYIDRTQILPLHLYWFSDGIYILHTTPTNKEILGHRIVNINNVPIKTIVDSLSTLLTLDNNSIIKSNTPKFIPVSQLLKNFRFANDNNIELGLRDTLGNYSIYNIKPAPMNRSNRVMIDVNHLALCYRNEQSYFIDYFIEDDAIYYIQYNKCWSKELEEKFGNSNNSNNLPSFNQFKEKVFQTMDNKQVNKLIIDLRFNAGGNSEQGTKFIDEISSYLEKNSDINLYVIIGRRTSSSAIINSMDLMKIPNTIFVGEKTSGKPNHYGEIKSFDLPNSRLKVSYSTKYFKRTEVETNTIVPDTILETSFNEFIKGMDPALEWIRIN